MKVWRMYIKGEIVGTYGTKGQAIDEMQKWFAAGYHANDVEIKEENF